MCVDGVTEVLIGIGSNLCRPEQQVRDAFKALQAIPSSKLVRHSSLYASRPQGPQDQEDYVNAAAMLGTSLSPTSLLAELQKIESAFGRVKTRRWGERVIDLDILFYGSQRIQLDSPELCIPHREALNRDFVMIPVLEIAPDWRLPGGQALSEHKPSTDLVDRKLKE